jgi:hypothetical protein
MPRLMTVTPLELQSVLADQFDFPEFQIVGRRVYDRGVPHVPTQKGYWIDPFLGDFNVLCEGPYQRRSNE